MSMSSGGSSGPGFRAAAGRRRATEPRSPVVYRENPMAYEPEKLCHCNPRRKAPRWISWSAQNPGRRYYACVDAMNGRGCGYVEWHDAALPCFWSDLLGDLRDEVWRLRGEQKDAPQSDEEGTAMVMALQAELKQKDEQLAAIKCKYESLMLVVVVFVIGLVAGKLFFK